MTSRPSPFDSRAMALSTDQDALKTVYEKYSDLGCAMALMASLKELNGFGKWRWPRCIPPQIGTGYKRSEQRDRQHSGPNCCAYVGLGDQDAEEGSPLNRILATDSTQEVVLGLIELGDGRDVVPASPGEFFFGDEVFEDATDGLRAAFAGELRGLLRRVHRGAERGELAGER